MWENGDGGITFEFTAASAGLYNIELTYYLPESGVEPEIGVMTDGKYPYSELEKAALPREWKNSGVARAVSYTHLEIDSISYFDPETQRREENADEIEISPAAEVMFDPLKLAAKLKTEIPNPALTLKQRDILAKDAELLENGVKIPPDRYIPLLDTMGTVFELSLIHI